MKEIYSKNDVLNELGQYVAILEMDLGNETSEEVARVVNNVIVSLNGIIKVFSK